MADVESLRKCKDADLVPIFLWFKLSNNRLKRSTEVIKARRKLLDNEIRHKEKRIKKLSNELSQCRIYFKTLVRAIDFVKYCLVIEDSVEDLTK